MSPSQPWQKPDCRVVGVCPVATNSVLGPTGDMFWVFWVRDETHLSRTKVSASNIPEVRP
jgi:hypothetical protein